MFLLNVSPRFTPFAVLSRAVPVCVCLLAGLLVPTYRQCSQLVGVCNCECVACCAMHGVQGGSPLAVE